ncbi:MAG: CotH kinase family protein [Saprospiraceae bacterium]
MMRCFALFLISLCLLQPLCAQDLYNLNTVTEIKLYFQDKNWHGLLDSLKRAGEEDRLMGDAIVNGKKYEKVGVRYKGNSSFKSVSEDGHLKLPFNIKVNEVNKKQLLPGGYGTLKLSNAFRDPSMIREILAYEIARKYMPAPKANFAKVYVNDQYLGIYHNVQSIDDQFLTEHFKENKGVLVKCDPDWTVEQAPGCLDSDKSSLMYIGEDSTCYMRFYEMKDKNGWKNFINFTKTLNQEPQKIGELLDIDQTLWMLAFNNVLVNLDSYTGLLCHNFYLYRDTLGVYHPMVWDMNMAFGGFRRLNSPKELTLAELQEMSAFVHYKDLNHKRPLIVKLLENDLNRKVYIAHMRTILNDYFVNGLYQKRAQELQNFILKYVEQDTQKLYSYEAFQQNLQQTVTADESQIVGIIELMSKRTEYLVNQPLFQKAPPKITAVTHKPQADKTVKITAKVEGAQKVWLHYRYGHGIFTAVAMESADTSNWTAAFKQGKNMQYYIIAEDERNASLSPARAAFEYHKVESVTPVVNKPKAKPQG